MRLGRYVDTIDKAFGDIVYTSTSKYAGHRAAENAMRYCRKHGYKIVGFDGKYDKHGYYHINTAYVIPAEYSAVEEYERVVADKQKRRQEREARNAEYTIVDNDGIKLVQTSNLSWALKVVNLRGGSVYSASGLVAQEGAKK